MIVVTVLYFGSVTTFKSFRTAGESFCESKCLRSDVGNVLPFKYIDYVGFSIQKINNRRRTQRRTRNLNCFLLPKRFRKRLRL